MRATDLNVGMELEVTGGANALLEDLRSRNLTEADYLHEYHCSCPTCAPCFTRFGAWAAQEDCTVDGEFITKPYRFGSDGFDAALTGMAEAIASSRATVLPNDCWDSAGNHVHVESAHMHDGATDDDPVKEPWPAVKLARLVVRYTDTLTTIAQGARPRVRGYNEHPATYSVDDPNHPLWTSNEYRRVCGDWVRVRPTSVTSEFRLWNATRAAWRMRLHAGLSAAMMAHACTPESIPVTAKDPRTFVDVIAPHADDDTMHSYYRQAKLAAK